MATSDQSGSELAGGQIVVTAAAGHLDHAELDQAALELSPELLAQRLTAAANDALDDLRRQLPSPDPRDQVDLEALARQLAVIRDEAQREMREIVTAIQDGMSQLGPRARLTADVAAPDTGTLFEAMNRAMEPLLGANPAAGHSGPADPRGTGQAGDGLVRAVAVPPGRVVQLAIDPAAVRAGSRELAEHVVAAVNAALDDLGRQRRPGGGRAVPADGAELSRRLQELRDTAQQQMADVVTSLSAVLGSIQPDDHRP